LPEITTREQWLAARKELLEREKAHTRQRDTLNADRRRLPMVEVDQDYVFAGAEGDVRLVDMFDGRRQLIVQHVMFGADWDDVCPGCTASLDEMNPGLFQHLRSRDTVFAAVSRAPQPTLAEARAKRGWDFRWYSSAASSFNDDYGATVDESEVPGVSCFLRDGDRIFHTYSTFNRGTDQLGSSYSWLDLTALGRQEDWEEPKDRAPRLHGADPTFTD
jgi:predicted dithiol-disulfide oxidoreductase (DUF899 family)